MTAGMQVNFSHGVFSDCCFTKVGLKAARMERCQLQYSVFTECNFDEADLTACAIVGCDMAGVRFKDSVLTHARWQNSSAQQAMFYNADLRDAGFEQCNPGGGESGDDRRTPAPVSAGVCWSARAGCRAELFRGLCA